MRAPDVPGAAVLAVDAGAGGREVGGLGEDALDLGAEDARDTAGAPEDSSQGDMEYKTVIFKNLNWTPVNLIVGLIYLSGCCCIKLHTDTCGAIWDFIVYNSQSLIGSRLGTIELET